MSDEFTMLEDVAVTATQEAAEAMAERLEYHLLGAWRAGYDKLHVYEPLPVDLARGDFRDRMTTTLYLLEGYDGRRPDPPGVRYLYSYDLTGVPDETVRAAMRGDLSNE